jgi:hypothetical protein
MTDSGQSGNDRVCGVDRALIERFLLLIRDQYRNADKAIFFLEQSAGVTSPTTLANLRDVLSHLATLLDEDTPDAQREVQLANAEEHLRRAVMEPYFIALGRLNKQFRAVYDLYKGKVLPSKPNSPSLRGAPDDESIQARLRNIAKLAASGRTAKGLNLFNREWESRIGDLIQAFVQLSELRSVLEQQLYVYEASQSSHVFFHTRWLSALVGAALIVLLQIARVPAYFSVLTGAVFALPIVGSSYIAKRSVKSVGAAKRLMQTEASERVLFKEIEAEIPTLFN